MTESPASGQHTEQTVEAAWREFYRRRNVAVQDVEAQQEAELAARAIVEEAVRADARRDLEAALREMLDELGDGYYDTESGLEYYFDGCDRSDNTGPLEHEADCIVSRTRALLEASR